MLVSVQIICTWRILKQWGLHEVSDTETLSEMYMGIVAGTIASGSLYNMPVELNDQPFTKEEALSFSTITSDATKTNVKSR